MAFWRLYYHLVWATKERLPMITSEMEPELYGYIIGKADALQCITHALGGIENHTHMIASVPPKLSVAEFVQKIKGSSAFHINHCKTKNFSELVWQRGYGVLSLGQKHLDWAVQYVRNQKEHHRNAKMVSALERDAEEDDGPAPWNHGKAIAGIKAIRGPSYEEE
jgi:REP element-mobilizing transposase RayT